MGVAERKARARLEREQRIVSAARDIAAAEGWQAVTVRRLAEEIEYSQPVLYSHFENKDAIVAAVAVEGFKALGDGLARALAGHSDPIAGIEAVALAYLAFAREQPAVYDAMFGQPTRLSFAQVDTKEELRHAFLALSQSLLPFHADQLDEWTENFWAALHGLASLDQGDRIRPDRQPARIKLLVDAIRRSQ